MEKIQNHTFTITPLRNIQLKSVIALPHWDQCGKKELLVSVKDLVSVEEPLSKEAVPSARFARYGRKINVLESCWL